MRIKIEAAGDERVEAGVEGLTCRRRQVRAGDGPELRADEDRGAPLSFSLDEVALGGNVIRRASLPDP